MPGVKDGPRNLKQMGAGRGAGASSGGRGATNKPSMKAAKPQAAKPPKTLYHGTSTRATLKKGSRLSSGSGATSYYDFAKSYAIGRSKALPSLSGTPRVLRVERSKTTIPARDKSGRAKFNVPGKSNEYKDPRGFVVKNVAKPPKKQTPKMATVKPLGKGPGRK